jgi:tetratricopeptide (TPR) repeat protein
MMFADKGDFASSERELRRALAAWREQGTRFSAVLINLGRVLTQLGRYDESRMQLHAGRELAVAGGDEEFWVEADLRLMELDTYEGHPQVALERLSGIEVTLRHVGDPPLLWTMCHRLCATPLAMLGRIDEARARAERAIESARAASSKFDETLSAVALARIAHLARHSDAVQLQMAADALVAEMGITVPDESRLVDLDRSRTAIDISDRVHQLH